MEQSHQFRCRDRHSCQKSWGKCGSARRVVACEMTGACTLPGFTQFLAGFLPSSFPPAEPSPVGCKFSPSIVPYPLPPIFTHFTSPILLPPLSYCPHCIPLLFPTLIPPLLDLFASRSSLSGLCFSIFVLTDHSRADAVKCYEVR